MTISLTVILIESTNQITYGLPIMIVLMVGDETPENQSTKGVVTNYGEGGGGTTKWEVGYYKMGRGGGQVKLYPYKKGGGAGKVLAMLKGGGGGQNKFYHVKKFRTRDFPIL